MVQLLWNLSKSTKNKSEYCQKLKKNNFQYLNTCKFTGIFIGLLMSWHIVTWMRPVIGFLQDLNQIVYNTIINLTYLQRALLQARVIFWHIQYNVLEVVVCVLLYIMGNLSAKKSIEYLVHYNCTYNVNILKTCFQIYHHLYHLTSMCQI